MNNKKIIFGILLFCAISFIAYTFANPLEKEEDEGKLVPGSNQVQTTPKEDDDKDKEPTEPVIDEPTEPVVTDPIDNDIAQTTRPTNTTRPSNGTNNSNNNTTTTKPTPVVEVNKIEISAPVNPTLLAGKSLNLGVSVSPSNATNKVLTYTSSDERVASVDANGNVVAVGSGTATITVTASNGVKNSYTLRVIDNELSNVKVTNLVGEDDLRAGLSGNTLVFVGSITPGIEHSIEIKIYVPKIYTADMIENLNYTISANANEYWLSKTEYNGKSHVRDLDKLSSGEAYVVFPLEEFGDNVIANDSGQLKIFVDWLNNGRKISYTLDFSKVSGLEVD